MSGIPWKHIVAVPVLLILYFYGLTRVGLLTPDEPRYASIGREMAISGDFVTPRLWGEPWFEKPALLYWLVAAGHLAGLQDEAAARTPVALIGAGFLFLFFHRLRREFGEQAAIYASIVLASSAGWLAYSHVAVTDIPLAATFAGAILMFLPWVRSGGRRGLIIGGILLGLAVLAKGLVPLVLALPVFWIARKRWVDLLLMTCACAAVAAPWYVLCWLRNGHVFIEEFFFKHHFGRFFSEELQHGQPWWYYLPVLLGLFFPWTPALALLFRREGYQDKRKLLLAAVAAFGLVFFSVSTNKLAGYILPVVPLIAALIGIRLTEVGRIPAIFAISGLSLAAVPLIAAALPSAILQGASRSPINWATEVPIAIGLFAILAAFCWMLESRERRQVAAGLILGATVICVGGLKLVTFPAMDSTASARGLWRRMQASKLAACAPSDAPRSIRYGLYYYAAQELPACEEGRDWR